VDTNPCSPGWKRPHITQRSGFHKRQPEGRSGNPSGLETPKIWNQNNADDKLLRENSSVDKRVKS
jgi:hypothetical protein